MTGVVASAEALVATQHRGEDGAGIELRRGEQAQLIEHRRLHLLGFVHQQHRAHAGVGEVLEPASAQGGEAVPAIVRDEAHAEDVAEFAVEVAEAGGGPGEDADAEVLQPIEAVGEQAQGGALAGAGLAGDEGKAPFAGETSLDPAAEVLHGFVGEQGLHRQLRREGVVAEVEEGQRLAVHCRFSSSRGR